MLILKVGDQAIQLNQNTLDKLLINLWGDLSTKIMDRLNKGKPVIKHGQKWQLVDHYQFIDNSNAVKKTAIY